MVVSKSNQTMTVHYGVRIEGTVPLQGSYTINVVTNVVRNPNPPTTQAFATANSGTASDEDRTQPSSGSLTNPTQLANDKYSITGTAVPSAAAGNVATDNPLTDHKFGQPADGTKSAQGLLINATQQLPEVGDPDNLLNDTGYMIHITPAYFTSGCIGIYYDPTSQESRDEATRQMERIVDLYNTTMSEFGDQDVEFVIED